MNTENIPWHCIDHFWSGTTFMYKLPPFLPPLLLYAKTQRFCPGLMVLPSVQPGNREDKFWISYKSFRDTVFLYILADHGYTSDYSISTANDTWKIIYLNCGERYNFMIDHRSYTHNLLISSCEIFLRSSNIWSFIYHLHDSHSTGILQTHKVTSSQMAW